VVNEVLTHCSDAGLLAFGGMTMAVGTMIVNQRSLPVAITFHSPVKQERPRSIFAGRGRRLGLFSLGAMTIRSDPDAATAMQYLLWALEHIEKTGDLKAAHHARLAMEALRERTPGARTGEPPP
jgi:hypothetical protein